MNPGFPQQPSVSSMQPTFQTTMTTPPPGMVPKVVGYMTTGPNPQYIPVMQSQPQQQQQFLQHQQLFIDPQQQQFLQQPQQFQQPQFVQQSFQPQQQQQFVQQPQFLQQFIQPTPLINHYQSPSSSTSTNPIIHSNNNNTVRSSPSQKPTTPKNKPPPSKSSAKPNELKDKHPCKHWDKCTKTNYRDHTEHGEKYYHPCKLGAKCTKQDDPVHQTRFVHPCQKGSSCTKLKQEEHCLHFTHPCPSGASCQKYLSADIAHCFRFTHNQHHDGGSSIPSASSNPSSFVTTKWPPEWENPPTLSKNPLMNPHFKMVTLSTSSNEYQRASTFFTNTSSGRRILKIERVENYIRWNWYSHQKQNMKSNHNETLLFHGTKPQWADKIAQEGFDARMSNSGKFGNGIYFSPDASYSLGYATGIIFISRVLVGTPHHAHAWSASTMAYTKPPSGDSVSGVGGQEIIVYDNKQAYPEYMITYQ